MYKKLSRILFDEFYGEANHWLMIVMKTIVKIPIGYISSVDFAHVYA